MDENFQKNCSEIKKKFTPLTQDERYQFLIEMGRKLPPFPEHLKTEKNLVRGCQSTLYLHARKEGDKVFFTAYADALISSGLAALLITAYSGLTAETILKSPPFFLSEIGITNSLSPSRSNGLAHIHLKMKQEAINSLIE